MIRDFAKHIVCIWAEAGGKKVLLDQLDKHTWQARPTKAATLSVVMQVYAWDMSVRGAHLDATHGFFNPSSLCLQVLGREHEPCWVEILPPPQDFGREWEVATSLPCAKGVPGAARPHGFGFYHAADYDSLIDHPVEIGRPTWIHFSACGVPHEVAITGLHEADLKRLEQDLKTLCEWQIGFWGEPAPFDRYVFLVTVVGEGYGGLEHRSSTALLCSRDDLPYVGMKEMSEGYRRFLGLCSHEYFHAWNVKRIKPSAFMPYALERENYTPLLWAFEGFTSYYDDLALVRAGLIQAREYLDLLQKNITHLKRTPGRRIQSVAQASFNAWTKYYRPDENTPNAGVSYYLKGALIALMLDAKLRDGSNGRVSLDEVMRALWKAFGQPGIGVGEEDIRIMAERLSGLDLKAFFKASVEGVDELELEPALKALGVLLSFKPGDALSGLGMKLASEGEARILHVFLGGAAHQAGLSAGDVIIALGGIKVSASSFKTRLGRYRPGDVLSVHLFRRDELRHVHLTVGDIAHDEARLEIDKPLNARQRRLQKAWMGAERRG